MKFPGHLNVAVVPKPHIFHVVKTHENEFQIVGGLEKNFLELLASNLKFNYTVVCPTDGGWGNIQKNGSWSGIIGLVSREEADIGLGVATITEERSVVVDHTYPYDMEALTFATPSPEQYSKSWAFISPFDTSVWLSILGLILFAPMYFKLCERNYSNHQVIFKVYGCILKQPANIQANLPHERIMIGLLLIGITLFSIFYSSVLLLYMTIPLSEKSLKNIPELVKAINKNEIRCFTFKGTSYTASFWSSKQEDLITIANNIKKNHLQVEVKLDIIMTAFQERKSALIAPKNFLQHELSGPIFVSADAFYSLPRVIVLSKKFCCKIILDKLIHRLAAGGFYQKFLRERSYDSQSSHESIFNESKPLRYTDFSSALNLLFSGYILSAISLVLEIFYSKFLDKKFRTKNIKQNMQRILNISKAKILLYNNIKHKSKRVKKNHSMGHLQKKKNKIKKLKTKKIKKRILINLLSEFILPRKKSSI